MRKIVILCLVMLVILSSCRTKRSQEPEMCSLCDNQPCHAPCIINLSTGEKLQLDVYEPHPFRVGELAEEQRDGYFSFVRGAGVEGYKMGGEYVVITIPGKAEKMKQKYFCDLCRERLSNYATHGYVLVDLMNPDHPIVYGISPNASICFRCYDISISGLAENEEYTITIVGT